MNFTTEVDLDSKLVKGNKIYAFYIKVEDIEDATKELIENITDTSWVNQLDPIFKKSYEKTVEESVKNLVKKFKSGDDCKITKDLGEFLVSINAGECLQNKLNHYFLPLSELWKEKVSNNHSFDMHTQCPEKIISFGEAKYRSTSNAYSNSAKQVKKFLNEEKDRYDLLFLRDFVDPQAIENFDFLNLKGLIVAFSLNSSDYEGILNNAIKSKSVQELLPLCNILYLIGVKV
ncbi:MAG: hypothetical protein NE327_21530 [Lentisphaeraceae bacterium]|nr:hypothetical protein [Lentisphaeraceae bacterium]